MDKYMELNSRIIENSSIFTKSIFNFNKVIEELGLTNTQFEILFCLHKDKDLTQTKISKFLRVSKSNLSPVIDSLYELGYIEKTQDRKDRRKVYLNLTTEGWEVMSKSKVIAGKITKEVLKDLPEEKLNTLIEANKTISDILKSYKENIGKI